MVLPRIEDAVTDLLELSMSLSDDETIDMAVLDIVDAFWNVPLSFKERRYFAGKSHGRYLVYLRAAQGSRNGPLSWAAMFSLILRLTLSLFIGSLRASVSTVRPMAL